MNLLQICRNVFCRIQVLATLARRLFVLRTLFWYFDKQIWDITTCGVSPKLQVKLIYLFTALKCPRFMVFTFFLCYISIVSDGK